MAEPRPPTPPQMSDAEFLVWCQDPSIPLAVRGQAYLDRTMQADIGLVVLTPDHAALFTAIRINDRDTLWARGWLQGDEDDPDPVLTPEATLMYFKVLAVRHADD